MCGLFSRLGNTGTIRKNKKTSNQLFLDSLNLNYANISRYTVRARLLPATAALNLLLLCKLCGIIDSLCYVIQGIT